jgi:DNA-binding response OmpR family regulator
MGKKVLIVEDDFMLSMMNRKYIELMGHTVVDTVSTGMAAIEAARRHNPDVILMDLRLEGELDGIDTMKEIGKFSQARAIYLTGNSDQMNRARADQTNLLAFCVKPVHYEQLKMLLSKP